MKGISVGAPSFEHHFNGLGVNTSTPRISWNFAQLDASCDGWQQASYDVEVLFDREDVQSFSVQSNGSVCVPWPARPLKSREAAKVRVRCYGGSREDGKDTVADQATEWSPWSSVEAALLYTSDWVAEWIAAESQERNKDDSLRPIRLTKTFLIPYTSRVRKARLYITSRGCYDAAINGLPVSDQAMAPGWQSYKHRLHYQILDVTDLLIAGSKHKIDVTVAAGWYASALAWAGGRRYYFGDRLALLAQLMVDFEDDSQTLVISSNDSWETQSSPIISSEIYNGEIHNLQEKHDPKESSIARVIDGTEAKLASPDAPPVRVTEQVRPIKLFKSRSGKQLIDFGQNLVGRLRIRELSKGAGSEVSFSHAEVLENDELGRRPLRGAASTDTLICGSTDIIDWAPKFTFHGFRYVEVTGWSENDEQCPLTVDSLVAEVLHTDMEWSGWFECSHPMVNKLHENARWSMRGNFLSIPTDCPQRDERLGWTGDIQVFAPSANFLYNTTGMLNNWLDDLAAEQLSSDHNGIPPFVVPDVISKAHDQDDAFWPKLPNAVWDDVAILLPWALYRASGDPYTLEKQYKSMTTWLDVGVRRGEDGLWDADLYQLGDWLDPLAPPSEPGNGRTNGTVVADAYLIHITRIMAESAAILTRTEAALRYRSEYDTLLRRFQSKYITPSGLVAADTQTALALTIKFGLLRDAEQLRVAGDRLARHVRMQQFRVATGFAGTPIILQALTISGHADLAYRMLLEKQCPSWMYAVSMGATTIWERWDSMLPDGSINPGEMTSFNHYALGSVVNWLHETVGGISALEPGWKKVLVQPLPGGKLTSAKVTHDSPYGRIECSWKSEKGSFEMSLSLPPNTTAEVVLPSRDKTSAGSGTHAFKCDIEEMTWPPSAIMPPFWPQPSAVCV